MADNEKNRGGLDSLLRPGLIDSNITPSTGLLSLFAGRPEVNSLYYNGKTVVLDGYTFVGCRFDNCYLQVSSLNFELIRCVVDPSTVIQYGPSAIKLIKLFNSRFDWAAQHFPGFVPIRNSDGSITVSDRSV